MTSTYQIAAPLAAYPYVQYQDDDDINAFFIATNQYIQSEYVGFFDNTDLGCYTESSISGQLLDWVAEGVYGMTRPVFPQGQEIIAGSLNTVALNTQSYNSFLSSGTTTYYFVSDDVFKRCLTWNFYRGDGAQFSVKWLKKRVMRFLNGANGIPPVIDNTYDIGISVSSYAVTINIHNSATYPMASVLQTAINAQVIYLPFNLTFSVVLL